MASLTEQLGSGDKRTLIVNDALTVLDQEVADKSGLTGLAIKGAYKVVQGIRPGFVKQVVEGLIDDFLVSLDPIYQEACEKRVPAGKHLQANSSRVADALLKVTDDKAKRANSGAVKATYDKLRPMAKKQVEAATPRLAGLLERHAAPSA
jgi:hypothetical protein